MAELDAEDRDKLPKSKFAYVDREGAEHLPIHDESHVRNAMARFNQTDFESAAAKESARRKILAAAKKHGIEVDADSNVAKPASRSRSSASSRSKSSGSRAKSSGGSKSS